jgi:hypothetical protein
MVIYPPSRQLSELHAGVIDAGLASLVRIAADCIGIGHKK